MLVQWKSDVVCLSETWLVPTSTTDSYLDVSDYFRRDRLSGQHGGLLAYVKPSLCPSQRTDIEALAPDVEVLVLQLKISPYGRCLLIFCYRSPTKSFSPT